MIYMHVVLCHFGKTIISDLLVGGGFRVELFFIVPWLDLKTKLKCAFDLLKTF